MAAQKPTAPADNQESFVDLLGSDPTALQNNAGSLAKGIIASLDKVIGMQSSIITSYVNKLRKRAPEADPAALQAKLDKQFLTLTSGSGASVGAAAALPGIGFITGTAAIGAESLAFIEIAAFYTMASAYLRGIDISEPERRRALVLVSLLGSRGTALVDSFVGNLAESNALPAGISLSRLSASNLTTVNNRLAKTALSRITKRLRTAWLGKLMPLGIGAALGTIANRKIAKKLIEHVRQSLGPTPQHFPDEVSAGH